MKLSEKYFLKTLNHQCAGIAWSRDEVKRYGDYCRLEGRKDCAYEMDDSHLLSVNAGILNLMSKEDNL